MNDAGVRQYVSAWVRAYNENDATKRKQESEQEE